MQVYIFHSPLSSEKGQVFLTFSYFLNEPVCLSSVASWTNFLFKKIPHFSIFISSSYIHYISQGTHLLVLSRRYSSESLQTLTMEYCALTLRVYLNISAIAFGPMKEQQNIWSPSSSSLAESSKNWGLCLF